MPNIRIMSWNLRTWGTHPVRADDCRRMADAILINQIDIVCIQELQVGNNVPRRLNAQIAQSSLNVVQQLWAELTRRDGSSSWAWAVSGCNYTQRGAMRDAYAFFWKPVPKASKSTHKDPVDGIEGLSEPQVLDPVSGDFPGRRPAVFTANIYVGKNATPLNLVSLHAMTPCNAFGKGDKGAGHSINSLAMLEHVGGGIVLNSGYEYDYEAIANPLPEIDTVILGDFNYALDPKDVGCNNINLPYKNLLTNYRACINDTSGKTVSLTTFSSDPTKPFGSASAYDNIFALKDHGKFKAAVTFTGQFGVYDFITAEVEGVAKASGISYFAREAVWFTVFKDTYRNQHAKYGISDHLPVWAEFSVGAGSTSSASQKILPTSGFGNNCLFHAVFGTMNSVGLIFDAQAAQRRADFANWLDAFDSAHPFKDTANSQDLAGSRVRAAVLESMMADPETDAPMADRLETLLQETGDDPFEDSRFDDGYVPYIQSIRRGRMLYVHEVELLAYQTNRRIVVHLRQDGQLAAPYVCNPNAGNEVHIIHQGLHFSRFNPNA